jgi:hypothetical protein
VCAVLVKVCVLQQRLSEFGGKGWACWLCVQFCDGSAIGSAGSVEASALRIALGWAFGDL